MSTERLGSALPNTNHTIEMGRASVRDGVVHDAPGIIRILPEKDSEALEFVRFCYRRRSVAWPDLYDEMCAVAARGDYRGMTYEELEGLGIGLALASLPRLAATVARVVAEERGRPVAAAAV